MKEPICNITTKLAMLHYLNIKISTLYLYCFDFHITESVKAALRVCMCVLVGTCTCKSGAKMAARLAEWPTASAYLHSSR